MSFLKNEYLENRIYQQNIHSEIFSFINIGNNILVVAPTSAGKTINELFATDYYLSENNESVVIILAPTNILCEQHKNSFIKYLNLPIEQLKLITGENSPKKRLSMWKNTRLIFTTPNCFINDLTNNIVPINKVKLVIFDEVHMTRKDHAYNLVANHLNKLKIRIIGFTASLGDSLEKQREILKNINSDEIIFLDKDNPTYAKYFKGSQQALFLVEPDNSVKRFLEITNDALAPTINLMRASGHFKLGRTYSKKEILQFIKLFSEGKKQFKDSIKKEYSNYVFYLYYYMIISYIQDCIVTGTYYEAYKFISEIKTSKTFPTCLFKNYTDLREMFILLESRFERKIFHPKVQKIEELLKRRRAEDRVIIFVNNHFTAQYLKQFINKKVNRPAEYILGQAHMKTDDQLLVIKDFEEKKFNILIATSVAEAGIHIPNVERIIHYNPPIDGVALIQRSGRTGRDSFGLIDFLVTNHEIELTRYLSAMSGRKRQKDLTNVVMSKEAEKKKVEQLTLNFAKLPLRPKGKSIAKKKKLYKDPKQLSLF